MRRRNFLKTVGSAAATAGMAAGAAKDVSIAIDPADRIAASAPALWAAAELEQALAGHNVAVRRVERIAQTGAGDFCIQAQGSRKPTPLPEAFSLSLSAAGGRQTLLASADDTRGMVYSLLEIADRVRHASDPMAVLAAMKPVSERPANGIRSVARLFTTDVEDKPWYNDREMWPQYLSMLAAQRFNKFHLAFGIGYDFLRQVTDAYFLFTYPFLLGVPGYNVRVPELPDSERDSNLAMLKFISEQTVARGMEFQLGLWMHGYEWIDTTKANYTIAGLTKATHGPYCRDAVRMLLKACPAISGVTFRVHGESGVEEGSYDFWKTVFEGVATCGRKVDIDMHSKGMDQGMIDLALAAGPKIQISPKYWAEHMGMPYHQADIRDQERPVAGKETTALMRLSTGSRSFTRYGYGDLLREDRRWGVVHRIWPGTQRLLLWGDPMTAAAHSRAFQFCGSDGVDICEPLSFKGRRGSGLPANRTGYADKSLAPRWDWQKYEYTYRVWGRLLYDPNSDPDGWRRYLRHQFQTSAPAVETALANASRILPIVTTAHLPSAANNSYWPEMYTNQSIVDPNQRHPYRDTAAPRVFGNASPLDPQLFSRMNEFADELLKGERSGKYSPIEVAQWIEDYAAAAAKHLSQAGAQNTPEYRRMAIDVAIQSDLGRFYGAKFRSGVLYRIHEQTGDRAALEEALKAYRAARAAWAELCARAKGVYVADVTIGELPQLRGHWLDRLPAIDADVAAMAAKLDHAGKTESTARAAAAIQQALDRPVRAAWPCHHTAPPRFHAGQPLPLELSVDKKLAAVRLYYRHVDQAERFESAEMQLKGARYSAAIPATYTDSQFPLQYYFELRQSGDAATLFPGLGAELTNQPYFVVRRA